MSVLLPSHTHTHTHTHRVWSFLTQKAISYHSTYIAWEVGHTTPEQTIVETDTLEEKKIIPTSNLHTIYSTCHNGGMNSVPGMEAALRASIANNGECSNVC